MSLTAFDKVVRSYGRTRDLLSGLIEPHVLYHAAELKRYGFWSMQHEARTVVHAAGRCVLADRGRWRMVARPPVVTPLA